jgi:hypothetical protein
MKKHQVDAEPFVVDPQAALAADEGKIIAEFEQERLEMAYDVSSISVGTTRAGERFFAMPPYSMFVAAGKPELAAGAGSAVRL